MANSNVQYQILTLSRLVFAPTALRDIWKAAFNAGSFTAVGQEMQRIGFTDGAIQEAQTIFAGGQWTPSRIDSVSDTLLPLPPYDNNPPHPNGTQAEVMVRIAKSIDRV